jgi:hypothetical protein
MRKTEYAAEGRECLEGRQHCELYDCCTREHEADGDCGYDGATVGHVATRRECRDRRSRENDGRGGARPCGGEPEHRERTSRDEYARRTDERRQPIRQAGPETSRTTKGSPGSIHKQRQAIERVHQARADHPEPSFAQRGPKLRLAHNRRGATRPIRAVELEPERDEQGKTHGGPQPNGKEQRRGHRGKRIRQAPVESK